MRITKNGEIVVSEKDIIFGLYTGKITNLSDLNIDDSNIIEQFNRSCKANADPFEQLELFKDTHLSLEEFDRKNQEQWYMPNEYREMDIGAYLLEQCKTVEEITRVTEELELFYQHNMIDVLKYLKYLVDTMRKEKVVWGVGRGSSCSSYCLFLLGIHKINSLRYQLDINEFLK
jgi:DNA polymerase III alpha subunit